MSFGLDSPPTPPYRLKLLEDFSLGATSRLGLFSTAENADLLKSKSWGVLIMALHESLLYESKLLSSAGLAAITDVLYSDVESSCNTQQLNSIMVKSIVFVSELLKIPDSGEDIQQSLRFLSKMCRQLLRIPDGVSLFRRDTQNILRVSYYIRNIIIYNSSILGC